MKILVRHPAGVLASVDLEEGQEYNVGRASSNDVVIPSEFVSRQHGRIFQKQGKWWYQDLRKDHPAFQAEAQEINDSSRIPLQVNIFLVTEAYLDTEATKFIEIQRPIPTVRPRGPGRTNEPSPEAEALAANEVVDEPSISMVNIHLEEPSRDILPPVPAEEAKVNLENKKPSAGELLRQRMREMQTGLHQIPIRYRRLKKQHKIALAGLGTFIVTVLLFQSFRSPMDLLTLHKSIRPRMVSLLVPGQDSPFCSGVIIAKGTVLTAGNCVYGEYLLDGVRRFEVQDHNGKRHAVKRILGFEVSNNYIYLDVPSLSSLEGVQFSGSSMGQGRVVRLVTDQAAVEVRVEEEFKDPEDKELQTVRLSPFEGVLRGTPVLDDYGNMLGLVTKGTELLATGAHQLNRGRNRYVVDSSPKKITVDTSQMRDYQPQKVLHHLRMPLPSADDVEALSPLSQVIALVSVPATLPGFFSELLQQMQSAVNSRYQEVKTSLSKSGYGSSDWMAQLQAGVPAIIPMSAPWKLKYSLREDLNALTPQPSVFSAPMPSKDFQLYASKLTSEERVLYSPQSRILKAHGSLADGALQLMLSKGFQSGGGSLLVLQKSANIELREKLYKMEEEFIISLLPLKKLSSKSPQQVGSVQDSQGRNWKFFSWLLEDETSLEIFCLPLPAGLACMSEHFSTSDSSLLEIMRGNYSKYELNQWLEPENFWTRSEMNSFFDAKLSKNLISTEDIFFADRKAGLSLTLRGFGINFKLPSRSVPLAFRFIPGAYFDGKRKSWISFGFEGLFKSKGKLEICTVAVEPKNSYSSAALNRIRKEEAVGGIWSEDLSSKRNGAGLTLFGYCAPLKKETGERYELDFGERRPFKLKFKLLSGS